jgi:hypothetical protein
MIMYLRRLLKIGLYESNDNFKKKTSVFILGVFFVQNSSKLWLPIDSSILAGD